MKTFTLAILGLLALANAEEEYQIDQSEGRKANPEPEKAYAHPGYEPPAGKRLAKRAAYKVGDDVITKKFDEAQIDQSEAQKANPEPDKAYAHPGYEQPAYKRLAKRQAPQPYAYPNDYHVAAAYPGPAPVTKINIVERLAKRDAAIYADPDVDPRVAPVGDVLAAYADPDVITRYARDLVEEEGDARKANPELTKAYANPGYEQPAYKRLAKRAAFKLADDVITKKFAEAQIDQSEARKANLEPHMAYAHPGYEQPAYKRLAKRAAHKLAEDLIAKKFAEARQDMRWPL